MKLDFGGFDDEKGAATDGQNDLPKRKSARADRASRYRAEKDPRLPRGVTTTRRKRRTRDQAVILIWGLTDQGKTALLWALGERLSGASVGGYSFGNKGDRFQAHWQRLNISLTETGWEQTQAHVSRIEGEELDLFTVSRLRARAWQSRVKIELVSMDVPGEHIQTLQGYQANNNAEEELLAQLRALQKSACAAFVVVRANELHKPAARRKASEYIRQSLSLLRDGQDGFRLAIVLTACDAIPDDEIRTQLGFGSGEGGADVGSRSHAAQAYLESIDPVLSEFFAQHPGIRCFATSAWGADKNEEKKVSDPRPRWVEDPILWVLDEEFPKREGRARRSLWKKCSATAMVCSVAMAWWLYTAVSGLIPSSGRDLWGLIPRRSLSVIPSVALMGSGDVVKSMLHDHAVNSAALGETESVEEALAKLEVLDPAGYYYSRARLEACRLEGERLPQTQEGRADVAWRRRYASCLKDQLERFGPGMDRYGRSVLKLRATTALARLSSGPGEQETTEVLEALESDPAFALQFGAEIYRDLWAGWLESGFQRAELDASLDVITRAGRLLSITQYLHAASPLMESLSQHVLLELRASRNGALIHTARWLASQPRELEDAFASQFLGGFNVSAAPESVESGLNEAFAAAYLTDIRLQRYGDSLGELVWNTVLRQADTDGVNRFLDTTVVPETKDTTAIVSAEWRALSKSTASIVERSKDLEAWSGEVIRGFSADERSRNDSLERYRFLTEVFDVRHPELSIQLRIERARVAAALIDRGFQEGGMPPTQVRSLLTWITDSGDATVREAMANLTRVAVDNLTVETRGREELIRALMTYYEAETGTFEFDAVMGEARERLAQARRQVIDLTLADSVSPTPTAFEKLVAIRAFAETRADDLQRLDSRIKNIAQHLLSNQRWNSACSDALAAWLNQDNALAVSLREFEQEGGLTDRLTARITEAISQKDIRLACWLSNAMAVISPRALESALGRLWRSNPKLSHLQEHASVYERVLRSEWLTEDAARVVSQAIWGFFSDWLSRIEVETADVSLPPMHGVLQAVLLRQKDSKRAESSISQLRGLELSAFVRAVADGRIDGASEWLELVGGLGEIEGSDLRNSVQWGSSSADRVIKSMLDIRSRLSDTGQKTVDRLVGETFGDLTQVGSEQALLDALLRWRRVELEIPPNVSRLAETLKAQMLNRALKPDWEALGWCWRCLSLLEAMGWTTSQAASVDVRDLAEQLGNNFVLFDDPGWSADAASSVMVDENLATTASDARTRLADDILQAVVRRWSASGVASRTPDFARRESSRLIQVLGASIEQDGRRWSWQAAWVGTCAGIDLMRNGEQSDLGYWAAFCPEDGGVEASRSFLTHVEGRSSLTVLIAIITACGERRSARLYADGLAVCAEAVTTDSWRDLGRVLLAIDSTNAAASEVGDLLATWVLANIRQLSVLERLVWGFGPGSSHERTSLADFDECLSILEGPTLRRLLGDLGKSAWQEDAGKALSKVPPRFDLRSLVPQPKSRFLQDYLEASGTRALEAEVRSFAVGGQWTKAWEVAERIGDASRRELWLAELKKIQGMVPVRSGETLVFVSESEVSVSEYDLFLSRARERPTLIGSLATELGLTGVRYEDVVPEATSDRLRQSNMPVHKISWVGAALYAAHLGRELPTRDIMLAVWGTDTYPWGADWDARSTNTSESGASVFAGAGSAEPSTYKASHLASPKVFRGVHGNVSEYLAGPPGSVAVSIFGASLLKPGKSVDRTHYYEVDASSNARTKKRQGVGVRTAMRSSLLEGK